MWPEEKADQNQDEERNNQDQGNGNGNTEQDPAKDEHSNGNDDNPPKSQDQIELITAGMEPDITKEIEKNNEEDVNLEENKEK